MEMLSPGVYTQELNLSQVTPKVGNSTCAFAGDFKLGSVGEYTINTSVNDLISNHGYPTDENFNDWFQAWNFLQYSNRLLISRAANTNGNVESIDTRISILENGQDANTVAVNKSVHDNTMIQFGTMGVTYLVTHSEMVNGLLGQTILSAKDYITNIDGVYTNDLLLLDGSTFDETVYPRLYELLGTNVLDVEVAPDGSPYSHYRIYADATNVFWDLVDGFSDATLPPVAFSDIYYRLFLDRDLTTENVPALADSVLKFNICINGIAEVGGADSTQELSIQEEDNVARLYTVAKLPTTINSLFTGNTGIGNIDEFNAAKISIPFVNPAVTKLRFISRNQGSWAKGIEICIAKPDSFYANSLTPDTHVTKYAFEGLNVDDLFEYAPIGKEFGIIVKYNDAIVNVYTVTTDKTSKDSNGRTNYIENVINNKSTILYVKENSSVDGVADTTMFYDALSNSYIGESVKLSHAFDSDIQKDDVIAAYELFDNVDDVEVDIIIANELDGGLSAKSTAHGRADCGAYIGANYDDVVGIKAALATANLINWRKIGFIKDDSEFSAVFGNYKYQYDSYNDVYRWVNLAGDVAGLRAQTNTNRDTWWASAGLERGKIKNVEKFAFNPTKPMRDLLYKNAINPCLSFPGMGAVCLGQKTLTSLASSFDRINVRGLFNTLERSLEHMAKYQIMEQNDTFTRNRIISMIKPYLSSVQAGRGIDDFIVICDKSNNADAGNTLIVDIYIKPVYVAEFIQLRFTNAGTNSFSTIITK